jgi:predicted HTH transcriptional regulator
VMKTVSAFANSKGGTILFGIDDDYNVIGIHRSQASRQIDQLGQLIRSWIEPTPSCDFDRLELGDSDHVVVELTVHPGGRLHACSKPNEPSRFYVRHHARTVPARAGEVEEIVGRRLGGFPPAWVPRG